MSVMPSVMIGALIGAVIGGLIGLGWILLRKPQSEGSTGAPRWDPQNPPQWVGEVKSLAQTGEKIRAIRIYRERTGCDLLEAKAAVDSLVR
jgi:hypothetical protein